MSTWMILAWGANSSTLPVALSSNLAPTAMMQVGVGDGHVRRVGAVHAEHAQEQGMVAGKPPRPMSVLVTGMDRRSARAISSFEAFDVMMPPPV